MAIEDPAWPRADQWLLPWDPERHPAVADLSPDLVVQGVPSASASLSRSRADLAPGAVRAVLERFSVFHGEQGIDLRTLQALDLGDWDLARLTMDEARREVERRVAGAHRAPVTVYLGGDNAITRPIVAGRGPGWTDGGVLTLDAHHDVRTLDRGPTNGTPIRGLIEDGLPGDHVAQVGIHSFANSAEYRAFCDDHGIAVHTMADVDQRGIDAVVGGALDSLASRCRWLHVDIDVDVLDVVHAPGCPGARPGGMTARQLARAAYLCGRHPAVVSADLVEVDPTRDRDGITVANAATALLSFCAGVAARNRP